MGGEKGSKFSQNPAHVLLGCPRAPGCQHHGTTPLFLRKAYGVVVPAHTPLPAPFLSRAERGDWDTSRPLASPGNRSPSCPQSRTHTVLGSALRPGP